MFTPPPLIFTFSSERARHLDSFPPATPPHARTKLKEFERLRGATAIGESEKKAMTDQLKALAEKNRSEKHRMDELLEGVIHSQKGELEKRKAEYVDLQARCCLLLMFVR